MQFIHLFRFMSQGRKNGINNAHAFYDFFLPVFLNRGDFLAVYLPVLRYSSFRIALSQFTYDLCTNGTALKRSIRIIPRPSAYFVNDDHISILREGTLNRLARFAVLQVIPLPSDELEAVILSQRRIITEYIKFKRRPCLHDERPSLRRSSRSHEEHIVSCRQIGQDVQLCQVLTEGVAGIDDDRRIQRFRRRLAILRRNDDAELGG